MNRLSTDIRARIVACLVEGNSIRATVRMTGAAKKTVSRLAVELGLEIKGWIGQKGNLIYYTDGKNVFRAPVGNAVDCKTGYLMGRWECSVPHWNRYCEAVYALPKVEEVKPCA